MGGGRAGGRACVTVRAGNLPPFVTHSGRLIIAWVSVCTLVDHHHPPRAAETPGQARDKTVRCWRAVHSWRGPEGVVIRPIKRSRVGEAFWISADRGMGAFGRGCDRLWVGGQGGLVAHLVLALELWLARWLAGSLACWLVWRIVPMCWFGRQAEKGEGEGRTESEAARSGEPCPAGVRHGSIGDES